MLKLHTITAKAHGPLDSFVISTDPCINKVLICQSVHAPTLHALECSSVCLYKQLPALVSSYLLLLVSNECLSQQWMHQLVRDNVWRIYVQKMRQLYISIDWKGLKIPCTVSRYKIPDTIYDVSFSSTSPDVLYILTTNGEIFSLQVSTLNLTKMVISGVQSTGSVCVYGLLCHNGFIYIQWNTDGYHVSKCIIEHNSSLRAISSYTYNIVYFLT